MTKLLSPRFAALSAAALAAALLTADEQRDLITTPEALAKIVQMDPAWVIENRARTLDRWNRWISS